MITIFYFILAAAALGILVFIHELGHYFAARLVGMKVETFSIGFGRPILKWRSNDVDWQLGWLPFGGYVKIAGMDISKKEKTYVEPYEIPDGFFGKAPWKRIIVAIAGPLSNFILAFLVFLAMWAMGGREKPFSDFTKRIGWVDPKSEIYVDGVRPGDILSKYNGNKFTNSKDLIYAAMLGGDNVELSGYHVLYGQQQSQVPFDYTIKPYQSPNALEGILTTGILASGKYLIYAPYPDGTANPLPEGSPMEKSGIQYGDRIIWADGELIFSLDQLSHLINGSHILATVKRGNEQFLTRIPRVHFGDLILNPDMREEVRDWQFEAGIKTKTQQLYLLPYNLTTDCVVEGPLQFIDKEAYNEAFPKHSFSSGLNIPLQAGDKIIAIDGSKVNAAYQLLSLVQQRAIQVIVKRGETIDGKTSWSNEDQVFDQSIDWHAINQLAKSIGTEENAQLGNLVLLNPIVPKRMNEFRLSSESQEKISSEVLKQRKKLEEIKDPEKRNRALQYFDDNQNKYILGIYLQDKRVNYNPTPIALFGDVFVETWRTLKALIFGYLNPKWLSGPIGIVQVIHHGWSIGINEALFWIGAISLNLGMLNLLPIPVLDGGYICLALWEIITGRRLKAKTMEKLIIPFVVLLVGLLIFLTFQDLSRLF